MPANSLSHYSGADVADIILAAISGTSFMTLFSYLVSNAQEKQFREPVLLAKLIKRLYPELAKKEAELMGWALHYLVGCMFTTTYNRLWKYTPVKRTILSGLVLGSISGLTGIAVWHIVFRTHPNPPETDLKNYYRQLLIAHLIFGAFAVISNPRKIEPA